MQVNSLPRYDQSTSTTGCCPKFDPEGWDARELEFRDKKFLRATTRSAIHIPLNMGQVYARVLKAIEQAGAADPEAFIVLSRDLSPWQAEHLFAITRDVPGEEMTTLSGDYLTRVFEGPYRAVKDWHGVMEDLVRSRGAEPKAIYFFYTTCPKCAKTYGKNYVVGVGQV